MIGADAERRRAQGLLPLAGACCLLLARLPIAGRGVLTISLLACLYAAVLVLSRPGSQAVAATKAFPPLLWGMAAVACARILFMGPLGLPASAAAISLSLFAAVAEEALFRGALFVRLLPLGKTVAVLTTALLFALLHLPFYGIAALPLDLGAGLLFSWQRGESGTWTVPAATHALANLLAVLP